MSLKKDHNDKFAQLLNNSFEKWDAGSPADPIWDKINRSLDHSGSTLEGAFDQWENTSPSANVWEKLNTSLDKEVTTNRTAGNEKQSLNTAFNDWTPEEPRDLWEQLDEDLSTSAVWDKLSVSLDQETDAVVDHKFKAAYQEWSTGTNHDGWTKLDDALSRERVWNRLAVTLTQPVSLPAVWWKYAASLIAFTFLSFFMNDGGHERNFLSKAELAEKEVNSDKQTGDVPANGNEKPFGNRGEQFAVNTPDADQIPDNKIIADNHIVTNNNTSGVTISENNKQGNTTNTPVSTDLKTPSTAVGFDDLAFLRARGLVNTDNCSNVGRISFFEPKRSFLSTTLSFGTQLSQSRNDDRSSLSSSAPRFGIAVDAALSRHFGRWGLTQDFGYVQFTQLNGDYIKGRYQNSIQQLNTIQSTSGIFYSFNRFDVNGGIVFTRILNGLEQESNKIINVYNTNKIQTGLSAGITYNFSPKRDNVRYGVGVQYQWIPNINAGTTEFRDVQGVKIQGKISF